MDPAQQIQIGSVVRFSGNQYKVIAELADHWLIVPNTGMYPLNPLVIPKEPSK